MTINILSKFSVLNTVELIFAHSFISERISFLSWDRNEQTSIWKELY